MKRRLFITFLVLFLAVPVYSGWAKESLSVNSVPVPPSLMLHSHSVDFLPSFLDRIASEGYTTTTYREFANMIAKSDFRGGKYVIISIDDYGPHGISPSLKAMADEVKSRDMVAVLGLVTGHLGQESWEYLSELERSGFEIASHSISHAYLPGLSETQLRSEIEGSYKLISDHLEGPVSLILPYGGFDNDQRILRIAGDAGYDFVVGISGGVEINGTPVFYVGRGSPNLFSAVNTLLTLENRFGNFLTYQPIQSTRPQEIFEEWKWGLFGME